MLIMNKKRISSVLLAIALILFLPAIAYSQSQPIVVLEYPNFRNNSQNENPRSKKILEELELLLDKIK